MHVRIRVCMYEFILVHMCGYCLGLDCVINSAVYLSKLTGHGVDGLKGDYFRSGRIGLGEQFLEMFWVVVSEDVPRNSAVTDSLDHRRVVPRVRIYLTT